MSKKLYYLGVDVETTGVNTTSEGEVRDNKILQIALQLRNEKLEVIDILNIVVGHDMPTIMSEMGTYVAYMHLKTGLLQAIESKEGVTPVEDVQDKLIKFIDDNTDKDRKLIAAGNNVQFDMTAIQQNFPLFYSMFHYSYLDVSSVRNMLTMIYPDLREAVYSWKESNHDALVDINECFRELILYTHLINNADTSTNVNGFLLQVKESNENN